MQYDLFLRYICTAFNTFVALFKQTIRTMSKNSPKKRGRPASGKDFDDILNNGKKITIKISPADRRELEKYLTTNKLNLSAFVRTQIMAPVHTSTN